MKSLIKNRFIFRNGPSNRPQGGSEQANPQPINHTRGALNDLSGLTSSIIEPTKLNDDVNTLIGTERAKRLVELHGNQKDIQVGKLTLTPTTPPDHLEAIDFTFSTTIGGKKFEIGIHPGENIARLNKPFKAEIDLDKLAREPEEYIQELDKK